ncbi:MAG: TRAP transporter small permease [Rhodospirillum sp.]|nr:TRAP transporter small permease [Rhodospirillum sp.]MCF8490968.1 TRAP transporter small permease [Rhodospirillum sp.]MCF8501181.1 TRAP transporter small permease [Rhodospirillum sp.]
MTAFADSASRLAGADTIARLAAHGCAQGDDPSPGDARRETNAPSGPPSSGFGSADPVPTGGPIGAFITGVGLLSRLCGGISATLILLSMLIVCQMVFVRYALNESTVWQSEAVIYMMIAATLVGLPYVQLIRGHVNVDLFPMSLSPGPRKVLAVLCLLVGMGLCLIFGGYGVDLVLESKSGGWLSETVWAPPLWVPFLSIPVGFLVLLLQFIADLLSLLTGRETPFGLDDGSADPSKRRH